MRNLLTSFSSPAPGFEAILDTTERQVRQGTSPIVVEETTQQQTAHSSGRYQVALTIVS